MKIGIDCRVLSEKEPVGVAKYTYNIVKNILDLKGPHEYVLFFDEDRGVFPEVAGVKKVILGQKKMPLVDSHFIAAQKIDAQNLDLVHFPAGGTPLALGTPFVTTVHDLAVISNPEWFEAKSFAKMTSMFSWHRAHRLIAVSNFTRDELIRLMNISADKISVAHEGVDADFEIGEAGPLPSKDYFVFVSSIEPRKNIPGLLAGFSGFHKRHPECHLVIVGKQGWKCEDVIKQMQATSGVTWTKYVPDARRNALIKGARALVYPSFYEGCGLPVLEAMSLGIPVIASNIPALKEVAGDGAVFFDLYDSSSMVAVMESVYNDRTLAADLIKKGRVRAAQFSWSEAARKTVEIFEQCLKNSQNPKN